MAIEIKFSCHCPKLHYLEKFEKPTPSGLQHWVSRSLLALVFQGIPECVKGHTKNGQPEIGEEAKNRERTRKTTVFVQKATKPRNAHNNDDGKHSQLLVTAAITKKDLLAPTFVTAEQVLLVALAATASFRPDIESDLLAIFVIAVG